MTSRRSMLLSLVLGAFLSVLGLNVAYSQVPRSISYQGLLVKNNQPVNALVNLHVKIYDAAGTTLHEENFTQVQVTNGIFNVLLGTSTPFPPNLKFDDQYFLGVNVDNTGEVTPKTPFTAAPYALNAQTVGGIGVSVTPQAGLLLPLDQNGKLPKSVLPASTAAISTIDHLVGDATGNIQLVAGNNITILDNQSANTITISATGGSNGIQTVVAGPGLIGGGSAPGQTSVTLQIAPNGITSSMLGTSAVRGINLDQNIPQLGLYQDALGQLNVGKDNTLNYVVVSQNPNGVPHGIGLNLSNPNTWLALQTFNAGITVNGTTTLVGPVLITGTTTQTGNYTLNGNMVVNGTPEPNVATAAAVSNYEIIDNGDLRVVGATNLIGNTFLNQTFTSAGNSTVGTNASAINTLGSGASSNNTIGASGSSINTMQGSTNTITGTTSNTITGGTNTITGTTNTITGTVANNSQAPTINIGTTQSAGNTVNIGTAGNSANTMTGTTNTITGTVSNSIQSPTNTIGTTNASSNNTIGNAATSTNTIQGATNQIQANTTNIGTTVGSSATNIGNALTSTNTIVGATNNVNATNNNIGTNANSTNTVGAAGSSTNTITGANNTITATTLTTFNGNVLHNGTGEPNAVSAGAVTNYELRNLGDFQNSGATNLIGNVFMNQTLAVAGLTSLNGGLTIIGPLTQSGGNAAIAGGAINSFGTVGSSNNTFGAAGSTNTITGANNNFNATTLNNFTGNTTTQNLQVNGTLGSTGNITLGTASSNNTIGTAGAINTLTGATNNIISTTATNFTGDIIQVSGRVSIAPTAGTTNNFGNAASQINNFGTGTSTTNNIGTGNGSVTNIGTVSGGGISTTNIGNLNPGTNNNINGLTTLQYTGDQTYVRIAGGVASCVGIFPTGAQSELLVNGDGFFDGTLAACRLNIFGAAASCITNLNTVNFGSCGGAGVPINLISSINGVPTGVGATDITNMRNIQASTNIQTNQTLTIGTTGTNATNITSSNPGPAAINQQTPTVSGKLPTYQTYQLDLLPGTGPNGGGAITFNAATTAGLINFDINDALMVTYRTHNLGIPVGALYVTSVPGVSVTVESSAANDNNRVQLTILRD